MKIIEVTLGFMLPITNEEADLLSKFHEGNSVSRKDLKEREIVIANNLVNTFERLNIDVSINFNFFFLSN